MFDCFCRKKSIQATVKELGQEFQTSILEKHGFVDKIIPRKELKEKITMLLSILLKKNSNVDSDQTNETSEFNFETREAS